MFIFQSKFNNPPYRDRITEKKVGLSKKNQWDFQISKVGSLDFLNLKVNGSPVHGEHSAILSTFIKQPFVIKIFVLSIFEWRLKTGFTVYAILCNIGTYCII